MSTDGGQTWRRARRVGADTTAGLAALASSPGGRRPRARYELLARATDVTGATQPDAVPHNTLGYLFGAVVRHPVTVV